ncbi:MAG: exo-alpha-sialidase [Opitutales bacterium]|nr:exo-alpha-sialidase [Opitutales bacterium]
MKSLPLLIIGWMAFVVTTNAAESTTAHQSPRAEIIRQFSIYERFDAYLAWPDMVRAANGDIVILFTRTEEHLGPDGEIMLVRSTDNGETWLPPAVAYDSPLDDRESGVTQLNDGRLLAHIRSVQWTPENYLNLPQNAYETAQIGRWIRHTQQPEYLAAAHLSGSWHVISDDSGVTWSEPRPGTDSIHGGIQLKDGSLLVASYFKEYDHIGVYKADSEWDEVRKIATVHGPDPNSIRFGEPHILQMRSGRILMMIRATSVPYNDGSPRSYLWASYSDDNGANWVEPYQTELWGFPPHLLELSDGRILCSYGHRRPPFGQRVCISEDGITWEKANELIIRDGANKDLGYPASIELEQGKILTIYYQSNVDADAEPRMVPPDPNRRKPGILGTIWQLP